MTTRAEYGERLALDLMYARSATWDENAEQLRERANSALELLDGMHTDVTVVDQAYLTVVRYAFLLAKQAVEQGRWRLAEGAIDAVHNVGELFRDRVEWHHEFFLSAFIDVFVKKWGEDAAPVEGAAEVLAARLHGR